MIELLLPTGNLSGCDCEQGSTRRPGWGPPPLAAWPAWGMHTPGGCGAGLAALRFFESADRL